MDEHTNEEALALANLHNTELRNKLAQSVDIVKEMAEFLKERGYKTPARSFLNKTQKFKKYLPKQ